MTTLFPTVILAGGLATRLHPISKTIPKSLITINDEPFIHHQLRLLHGQSIREVVMCVGYLGEMIEDEIGHGHDFGMNIQYSYDGTELLGTAGAIKKALPLLGEHFFVLYGDSYLTCDYREVQESFLQQKKLGLMTVFQNAGKWDTSNIEFKNSKIHAYDKKNRTELMQHIDYGLGILTDDAFSYVPVNKTYDLALLYQNLLINNQLAAYEVSKRFYEVGSFAGIKELEYYLANQELVGV